MIYHHKLLDGELKSLIIGGNVRIGGNLNLKIYGRLNCASGKRMKKQNRVFFTTESEAIQLGFRPCGNCMRVKYKKWISSETN